MKDPYEGDYSPYTNCAEYDALGSITAHDCDTSGTIDRMLQAFETIFEHPERAQKIARDMLDPLRRAGPCKSENPK